MYRLVESIHKGKDGVEIVNRQIEVTKSLTWDHGCLGTGRR